jgi:hypothetical protein
VDKVLGGRVRVVHEGRRTRNKLEANGNWAAGVVDITEDDDPVLTVPLVLERLSNRGNKNISWILRPFSDNSAIVKHKHGEFSKEALMRLEGGWLNSAIVDFYLKLILNRHMRARASNPLFSFFILETHFIHFLQDRDIGLRRGNIGYNYDKVKSMTSTAKSFELNSIFIPVNIGNYHWTFIHIDMMLKKILYYDSIDGSATAQKHFTLLRWWLADEAAAHSHVFDPLEWSDIWVQDGPTQNNSMDCGVYVIKGIEQLTKGLPLDHSPSDITAFRWTIFEAILFGCLKRTQSPLEVVFDNDPTRSDNEDKEDLLFKQSDFSDDEDEIPGVELTGCETPTEPEPDLRRMITEVDDAIDAIHAALPNLYSEPFHLLLCIISSIAESATKIVTKIGMNSREWILLSSLQGAMELLEVLGFIWDSASWNLNLGPKPILETFNYAKRRLYPSVCKPTEDADTSIPVAPVEGVEVTNQTPSREPTGEMYKGFMEY